MTTKAQFVHIRDNEQFLHVTNVINLMKTMIYETREANQAKIRYVPCATKEGCGVVFSNYSGRLVRIISDNELTDLIVYFHRQENFLPEDVPELDDDADSIFQMNYMDNHIQAAYAIMDYLVEGRLPIVEED